ncbi:MAG: CTP synthase [Candidatus Bathyarchaeota archaeon]|nr:CTP synthase [Candidatus Bathyarchaeota archaeon]MDH5687940.1 CTP synthase [Candidatus Bathyarchaeota archaeon]
MVKFIFVTGGVLSSVGKGIATSSVGKMLQVRGFNVTAVKIDPYVNVDAGTMNPYIHGEVYVTDDGGETDLDLGWYERFLNINIPKENNITTGQVYQVVISKERTGDFLGRCVQIIPHITDEIKSRISSVAERSKVDVVLAECGGTVGDIEGLPFLEAIRQMRLDEGFENTLYIHVALVPILDVTGEMKTKPLQHSVNELRRIGIQPDIIIARCREMITSEVLNKIALFGTIPEEAVFCSYNVPTIYEVPLLLDEQGMGDYTCRRLGLEKRSPRWEDWRKFVSSVENPEHTVRIALVGKYAGLADSYVSMNEAFRHSGASCNTQVLIDYIEAEIFEDSAEKISVLGDYDGIFVPYGFGPRGIEGKIKAIQFAREKGIPFLGICYGFQLAVVEFARHECGLEGANSTEIDEATSLPVIYLMPEQRNVKAKGATMRLGSHKVIVSEGTLAYSLYESGEIYERHRHRWEVNPEYWDILQKHGIVFSGKSPDGRRIEILELPDRFFFFASQFHGEFESRPRKPEPEYYGFVKACLDRKLGREKPEFYL